MYDGTLAKRKDFYGKDEWTFDPRAMRYRKGKALSYNAHSAALNTVRRIGESEFIDLARRYNAGKIDLAAFQLGMLETVRHVASISAMVGRGGLFQMNDRERAMANAHVRGQANYLAAFVRKVERGEMSPEAIERRAAMYALANSRQIFSRMEREAMIMAGFSEARRVQHSENPCTTCAFDFGRGWHAIDHMIPVGDTVCGPADKCTHEFRRKGYIKQDVLRINFGDEWGLVGVKDGENVYYPRDSAEFQALINSGTVPDGLEPGKGEEWRAYFPNTKHQKSFEDTPEVLTDPQLDVFSASDSGYEDNELMRSIVDKVNAAKNYSIKQLEGFRLTAEEKAELQRQLDQFFHYSVDVYENENPYDTSWSSVKAFSAAQVLLRHRELRNKYLDFFPGGAEFALQIDREANPDVKTKATGSYAGLWEAFRDRLTIVGDKTKMAEYVYEYWTHNRKDDNDPRWNSSPLTPANVYSRELTHAATVVPKKFPSGEYYSALSDWVKDAIVSAKLTTYDRGSIAKYVSLYGSSDFDPDIAPKDKREEGFIHTGDLGNKEFIAELIALYTYKGYRKGSMPRKLEKLAETLLKGPPKDK